MKLFNILNTHNLRNLKYTKKYENSKVAKEKNLGEEELNSKIIIIIIFKLNNTLNV